MNGSRTLAASDDVKIIRMAAARLGADAVLEVRTGGVVRIVRDVPDLPVVHPAPPAIRTRYLL